MKVFKYIFIIVVIALVAFSGYTIYKQNNEKEIEENKEVQIEEKQVITNMRIGISKYDTMNPLISTNKSIQYIDKLIFEPLLSVNEDYSLSNCLAKEYSKTGNNTYLIKLRDDINWHDGMPLVAQDIQFTIDHLKDGSINSIYEANLQNIVKLDIIDDHTVKLTLDKEVPFFEYNLIFPILPYHYYIDEDFANSTKVPIGTGMFKIKKIDSSFIELVRNDEWWNKDKQPKLETITLNLYTSMGELYNAFKIGNIDIIQTTNPNYSQYIGTIGYEVKEYVGRDFDFLAMNTSNNILKRKEIRQAIAASIDKNNIVATIFNNTNFVCYDPLDYGNYLYARDVGVIQYNVESANKILEENEWTLNYGIWTKNENYRTLKTSFNLIVNSSNVQRVAVAETIKNQLADSGIQINVHQVSDAQYQSYLDNKNYDLIITGKNIAFSPNLSTYFSEGNLAKYTNEEINKILNSIKSINDSKMLKEYYKKMQEIYQEEAPYIALYRNKEYLIYNSSLVGDLKPTWFNIYYNIENWYRQN